MQTVKEIGMAPLAFQIDYTDDIDFVAGNARGGDARISSVVRENASDKPTEPGIQPLPLLASTGSVVYVANQHHK